MRRRAVAAVAVLVVGLSTVTAPALGGVANRGGTSPVGRFDEPGSGFLPPTTLLVPGAPQDVGLDPAPIAEALSRVAGWTEPVGEAHPLYGGAVTVLGHHGVVVADDAVGWALRYADLAGTELPLEQRVPMRTDAVFDLASLSKLFTSITAMQLVEQGLVDLDAPVAQYVPEFAENGKGAVTVRQLLTHTAGLPPFLPLWRDQPDPASRMHAALTAVPVSAPGEQYLYSDLSMITLGELVARVSGRPLDAVVRARITEPLGMVDTGYNPTGSQYDRAVATEFETVPPRGMVRGEVHDENAWALGGVAGHAGVFSTGADLAVLAQALLNGGTYDGARILRQSTVDAMLTNENTRFPGDDHGLGFELDQRFYMDGLAGPRTAGHTGFTGTTFVVDPMSGSFSVFLSNRVHPDRAWGTNNPARRAVAGALARALQVPARHGPDAWSTPAGGDRTSTLDAAVDVPAAGGRLSFDAFVDVEESDPLVVETSADGGTTWTPVPLTVRDRGHLTTADGVLAASGHRRWWQVTAPLPAGPQVVRWRYTTDATEEGRGVRVDRVLVVARGRGVVLDGEREPDGFVAVGWRPSAG